MKQWGEYEKEIEIGILPTIKNIIEFENLRGVNRRRDVVQKRYFLMWFLRKHIGMSFERIGNLFLKDHSTVIHGVKYHDESIEIKDEVYFLNIEKMKEYLEAVLEDIPHST